MDTVTTGMHAEHDAITLGATLLVSFVGLVAIGIPVLARLGRFTERRVEFADYATWLAAGLSVCAAAIHFAVLREQFTQDAARGVFFAIVAWLQVAWAMLVIRRWTQPVLLVGVILNLAVALVWLGLRTGQAVGALPGAPEPGPQVGTLATVLEVASAAVASLVIAAERRTRLHDRLGTQLSTAILLVTTTLVAIALVTSAALTLHGHDAAGEEEPPAVRSAADPTASQASLLLAGNRQPKLR